MELYYQCKVKYTIPNEEGVEKRVTESCITCDVSVSAAESRTIDHYINKIGASNIVVMGVTEASISTVVNVKEKDVILNDV